MGVGIGEAGANPAAHSLITDYYPAERRAFAFSIYNTGLSLGVVLGAVAGGYCAMHYGWRTAFILFGLPGVLIAALTRATLPEPVRGGTESQSAEQAVPSLSAVLRHIGARPALLHLIAGGTISSFAIVAIISFSAPFFVRQFELSLAAAGLLLGISSGVSVGVGTLLGGLIVHRAIRRDVRWYMWVPVIALAAAAPLYAIGFAATDLRVSAAFLVVAPVVQYLYFATTFAVMHNMVYPRMRATAAALLYLISTVLGTGLGPTLVGVASDWFASRAFVARVGEDQSFTLACPGGVAASGSLPNIEAGCRLAAAHGIKAALLLTTLFLLWAAVHYALGARTLKKDLVSA